MVYERLYCLNKKTSLLANLLKRTSLSSFSNFKRKDYKKDVLSNAFVPFL